MLDLTVEDVHLFLVGEFSTAVFVHNCNIHNSSSTAAELHDFGNAAGPRPPRAGIDFEVGADGMVVSQSSPIPSGASTFADPAQSGLSGVHPSTPAGTEMRRGSA